MQREIGEAMRKYLVVGSGGALGALVRYWLGGLFKIAAGDFPYGTFIINLTGSFVLGLFLTLITERYRLNAEWRLFFATGFVGAYTTFSSFTNEILALYRAGYVLPGLLYSMGSLLGGMLCVWLGLVTARWLAFGSIHKKPTELERKEQSRQDNAEGGAGPTGRLPSEQHTELEPD